jgi:ribosomal protein L31E
MKFDLVSILLAIEASTPDGRWNLLQEWLKENPEYNDLVKKWSTQPSDQAFLSIRDFVAQKWGLDGIILNRLLNGAIEDRIKKIVETLQVCYRERANQQPEQQKEIKNVRARKSIKGRSAKNHR